MKTISYNPETHRLVPVEPTESMAGAGWDDAVEHEVDNVDIYDIAAIYRAMLSAAPQPEPVEVEPVAYADSYGNVITKATKDFSRNVMTNSYSRALYTAPPDYEEIKRQRDELAAAHKELDLRAGKVLVEELSKNNERIKDLEKQRDEMVKALEWQPIETAPKDGQAFDVWVMSTKNKSYGVRMTNVYYNNGVICGMRYPDASFGEYASNWMPLPAAPAALASVKGGAA